MTFSRRRFFVSTTIIAVATPLIGVQAFPGKSGYVVTEPGIRESRSFASIVEPRARIEFQLGDVMRLQKDLDAALLGGVQILGATQEAGALVIEELLRGKPYRLDILGRHRQIDLSTIRHDLSGLIASEGRALFESHEWPARLALSLIRFNERPTAHTVRYDIALPRPGGSPGYMTTWRIART